MRNLHFQYCISFFFRDNYVIIILYLFRRVEVTEDGKTALIQLAGGDMRKVLNVLQSTSMAFDIVNEQNVYTCVGHPQKGDILNIFNWLLNTKQFSESFDSM